jgi:SagB-type dehydrogenase family enzyme
VLKLLLQIEDGIIIERRKKMRTVNLSILCFFIIGLLLVLGVFPRNAMPNQAAKETESKIIKLPNPRFDSQTSVEKALSLRRSVRAYSDEPLSISDVSQILWAAQGITKKMETPPPNFKYKWQGGGRTAPSAGALYPLELYLAAGNVEGLLKGLYKYIPQSHSLEKVNESDLRNEISNAALMQESIKKAAAVVVIAAVYERTSVKYGERAQRYVHIEVGHVGQNIYLQGISLGIGTVMVGAFADEAVKKALQLPEEENPLAIMPLGKIPK